MTVTRLNHAVLYVRDAERAAAFYQDVLGFEVVTEMPGAAFLRAAGTDNHHDLGLFSIGPTPPAPSRAGSASTTSPGRSRRIEDLADWPHTLRDAGALVGASDHGVVEVALRQGPRRQRVRDHVEPCPARRGRPSSSDGAPIAPTRPRRRAGPLGSAGAARHRARCPTRQIAYEVADGVATITLDRPDRLNAFTVRMQQELCAAVDEVDADPEVRAVVVTGSRAGLLRRRRPRRRRGQLRPRQRAAADAGQSEADGRHRDEGGLVVAAVLRLHQADDRRHQRPRRRRRHHHDPARSTCGWRRPPSKFGFVFARRGLVPEACSSWFLPRVVGISRAMEWCATGRVFGPDEALAGGLVRSIHEPDDLLPAAYELAAGDRRQHLGRLGDPDPGAALAHARCAAPDGRPPDRLPPSPSGASAAAPTSARAS